MGTNYYVKPPTCEHCGRSDKRLHIGKASAGWAFLFRAYPNLRASRQWRDYLATRPIVDEYMCDIPWPTFWEMVELRKLDYSAATAPATMYGGESMRQIALRTEYSDEEGYRFCTEEFS